MTLQDNYKELLYRRHSGRSYDITKPVPKELLVQLIEAAHLAPSCYNDQPWHFLILDKHQHSEGYAKLLSCLAEANQAWAKNAPLLILVIAGSKFRKNQKPNRWGQFDSGASALCMAFEATVLGLMAHQMGGFDENKAKKELNIPEEYTPMSVMAVGYETESTLSTTPPKDRIPPTENFFYGEWKKPLV